MNHRRQLEAIARAALRKQGVTLPATPSRLVVKVDALLAELGMRCPAPEHAAIPGRNFAFDRAWPELRIAVEIEGGVHRTKKRFESDAEKYFLAALHGWRVFRVTPGMVKSGLARELLKQLRDAMVDEILD